MTRVDEQVIAVDTCPHCGYPLIVDLKWPLDAPENTEAVPAREDTLHG